MRYFAKLGANNEAINIYRFEVGETTITEDRWDIRSKSWVDNPDADVVRYLTQGEGEFQEVTEDVARQIFPDVFTEETTKSLGKFDLQKAVNFPLNSMLEDNSSEDNRRNFNEKIKTLLRLLNGYYFYFYKLKFK